MSIKSFIKARFKTYSVNALDYDRDFEGERPANAPELGLIEEFKGAIRDILRENHGLTDDSVDKVMDKFNYDINNWYYEGRFPSDIASQLSDESVSTYSESLESLKSKIIEGYAPVFESNPEGFEMLKEAINEADVDLMKNALDSDISNWSGARDPIIQKAVNVSKEVRAKLDEIKTYSKASDFMKLIYKRNDGPWGIMQAPEMSFEYVPHNDYDLYHGEGSDSYVAVVVDKASDQVWMLVGDPEDPTDVNQFAVGKLKDLNKLDEFFTLVAYDYVDEAFLKKFEKELDEGKDMWELLDSNVKVTDCPHFNKVYDELKTYWKK